MFRVTQGVSRGFRLSVFGLVAAVGVLTVAPDTADARRYRRQAAAPQQKVSHRVHAVRESGYSPPFASIVVDANTGQTIQEKSADSLRHPASLTKIMTLYLLFERLDAGKMKLSTMMPVSEHAAEQSPTKLMTLYLLFERLDAGKRKLSTMMPVSEHAAEQSPTKLMTLYLLFERLDAGKMKLST